MTDREAYLATTSHQPVDRLLYHANFTPDLRRRLVEHVGHADLAGHFGFMQQKGLGLRPPAGYQPPDYSRYWEGEELPEGTKFSPVGAAQVPSGFYHFFGYISPLRHAKSLKEIEEYPIEDHQGWTSDHLAAEVAEARAAGIPTSGGIGHIYEQAWQIRGYEEFLIDMMERPAWAECLLERLANRHEPKMRALAAAGVDWLHCGDDVANQNAMMFRKDLWERMIHRHWRRLWGIVKEINPETRIWYHSDGNIIDIVPDLVDAGVDVLNPLQPECLDLDAIHRRFGDRLTFDGTMGTQSTMPWGTPDDVRARVAEVAGKYGQSGGLIVSPTHVLEPEVPIANIEAMAEACRDWRP